MKKYELLLFDIDGTLLDFDKAEEIGMQNTLKEFGLISDDRMVDDYREINQELWKMYERGEVEKERLLIKRHEVLFEKYGFQQDPKEFNDYYERCLSESGFLIEHAFEILEYIKGKGNYEIAIITNGLYETQVKRIALSGLDKCFEHIYISDKVGYNKPQKEIFEYIFNDMDIQIEKDKVLIIGDSLTSDIKGGNNFGIDTCWFNPKRQANDIDVKINYEIQTLMQLKDIV